MTPSILLLFACVEPPDSSSYESSTDNPSLEDGLSEDTDDNQDSATEEPVATQPALELDTTWLDFGEVTIGDELVLDVVFTNGGDLAVEVLDVELPSGTWQPPKALPWSLYPGEAQAFRIGYQPDEEGEHGGVVRFLTDHPDVPTYQVEVTGLAIDDCEFCAPRLETNVLGQFLSLLGFEDTQAMTVENTGDRPLTISDVYVNNDDWGGEFWVDWSGERVVEAGGSISFQVGYVAVEVALDVSDTSADTNILHLLSDDPDSPDTAIGLSGLGIN